MNVVSPPTSFDTLQRERLVEGWRPTTSTTAIRWPSLARRRDSGHLLSSSLIVPPQIMDGCPDLVDPELRTRSPSVAGW